MARRSIVIGVAPAGFDYPSRTAVWTPTTFDFERLPENGSNILADHRANQSRASHSNKRKACLKARCDRSRRSASLGAEVNRPRLIALREQLAGPVRQASNVLMGVAVFVLLIACANVANLLLSRMTERQRELRVENCTRRQQGTFGAAVDYRRYSARAKCIDCRPWNSKVGGGFSLENATCGVGATGVYDSGLARGEAFAVGAWDAHGIIVWSCACVAAEP